MPRVGVAGRDREAEVKQPRAQLAGAKWNLDKTIVRAPADGFVTNVALRKGARVASLALSPARAFIKTSETIVAVQIAQIKRAMSSRASPSITFK